MRAAFLILLLLFARPIYAETEAAEHFWDDAVFYERFIPKDSVTIQYMDMLEWKVDKCVYTKDVGWVVIFDIVGQEDPEMETFAIVDGDQPIYHPEQGWVSTQGLQVDTLCSQSATS